MMSFLGIVWTLFVAVSLVAQPASTATGQKKSFVLMALSAHPDDEDGATLAYYARFYNSSARPLKAYSVFYTRGEGGQNEIGSALYDELGEIRTQETLDAGNILGTETLFLGFRDFGFSKTAKETFTIWGGKDAVLSRLVYLIRRTQPDVIITNHDTITVPPNRQHGHHQAVGITAYEAFEKAADSSYHPEQFKDGVAPWQVKKLFVRAFRSAPAGTGSVVEINVGEREPGGKTIREVASLALSQHRSQGMDKAVLARSQFLAQPRRYMLWRASENFAHNQHDLFGGIEPMQRQTLSLESLQVEQAQGFSILVSPSDALKELATEREWQQKKTPTYKRRFHIVMRNPTQKILPVILSVSSSGKTLLRKEFVFGGTNKARLTDTLTIDIEKDTSRLPQLLIFDAKPVGAEAEDSKLSPAKQLVTLKTVDAKCSPSARIGLVNTYDNTLEDIFRDFKLKFTVLDSAALESADLKNFSVIFFDLRTGGYRPDVMRQSKKIFDYIEQGGNVVMFYNKPQDWNANADKLAPYPILITNERVTEETATVKLLQPEHPYFNKPNKILPGDWNGWIQERSIYLPSADSAKTSEKYERLLSMSDENESQPSTSFITAYYGRGTYTYISLALYRQLKLLQTGSVKLLLNLASQPIRR